VFVSRVTAPFRASARPCRLTPLFSVIDVSASMFPLKIEFVPRVAELPTCQKMFLAWAPPASTILVSESVMSVEPILKIQTAFALPWASRVRIPFAPVPDIPLEVALA